MEPVFDASCLEICYSLLKFELKFQDFHSTTSNTGSIWFNILSLFWCQLLENLWFCDKQCIENNRGPSNWHQIQVPYDAIVVHCFDASCLKIYYFVIHTVLKITDFQVTGIKYRLHMMQCVHCFDASCLKIYYSVINNVLKITDFQAIGINYRFHVMQYVFIVLMPVEWKCVILQ